MFNISRPMVVRFREPFDVDEHQVFASRITVKYRPAIIPWSILLRHELATVKNRDGLRAKPCQKERPSLHSTNLMSFVFADF